MLKIESPRATRDYLPNETAARSRIEADFARVAAAYGFQKIQTPVFEHVELFSARSGPEIKSSMLTFHCDHEEFALRPEMTAAVCRLMASGALDPEALPHKLFYLGPCFRYCRPQSGRYREFTQAGLECVGAAGPQADAEMIAAASRFLGDIGAGELRLKIGNIGIFRDLLPEEMDAEDHAAVIGHLDRLISIDEKCRLWASAPDPALLDEFRLDRMELSTLQAEVGYAGPEVIAEHPRITDGEYAERLPREAAATFRELWSVQGLVPEKTAELLLQATRLRGPLAEVHHRAQQLLTGTKAMAALDELVAVCRHVEMYDLGEFEVVLGIARGFTFYTSTVFEITSANGGEKYCGGGRYDRLVELFGGPALPATGCAFRFDELAEASLRQDAAAAVRPYELCLLAESAEELRAVVSVAEQLRDRGVRVGVGAGSSTEITAEHCAFRKTSWIAVIGEGARPGDRISIGNGRVAEQVAFSAEALAEKLHAEGAT